MLFGLRNYRAEGRIDSLEHELAGLSDLQRQRRIEHIRRGQSVVEPTPHGPELLGDGVDERRYIVLRALLDLRNALGRGRHGALTNLGRRLRRYDAHGGPAVERSELDVEP